MSVEMNIYECGEVACHTLFSVEINGDANYCPQCKSENITCVGNGTLKNVVEH